LGADLTGLNDAVIGRRSLSRLLRLEVRVRDEQLSHFPCDGVIVATPTGSTAYSLAAGGPVVDPRLRALLLTPICPHTLSARPLVVEGREEIEVLVPREAAPLEDLELSVDGQVIFPLQAGDRIRIKEAPYSAKLLRFEEDGFYERLRAKLGWGTPP
jgi:NAD+ kinase